MRTLLVGALVLLLAATAHSRKKKSDPLAIELENLNSLLENVRDSLEAEISARYTFKQHTVEQRQTDKEEYERLREKQSMALNTLSKIKEEALVKEQNLGEAERNKKEKIEDWNLLKISLEELMQKEADGLIATFPMDLERRQGELEEVRRRFLGNRNPISGWEKFLDYRLGVLADGKRVTIAQAKLLPNDGIARLFSIARFGNVFAYCMDSEQQIYMIHQTGSIGASRFAVEAVVSSELQGFIRNVLPEWIQKNKASGTVMTEVMQNEKAKILIAGKEEGFFHKILSKIKAGGWVMVPLLLLPFWIAALALQKLRQFRSRDKTFEEQLHIAFAYLDKGDTAETLAYAKSNRGLIAKILEACLESPKDRDFAENEVRKLITQETPVLTRNLNTMAVIASAAPLLGLLGTISGMIALFTAVTYYGTGDPKFLAGGISEALITSQTGLIIAIPTLFIHDYFRNRKERLLADIETMALRVLDKIIPEV